MFSKRKPSDGVVRVALRERDAELLVEVVDVHGALDFGEVHGDLADRRLAVFELVREIADDFLEQVLDRHEPRRTAVFVLDDREVLAVVFELLEELRDLVLLSDEVRLSSDLTEDDLLAPQPALLQILDVEDAGRCGPSCHGIPGSASARIP